ncbi:MAG: hypothetical protein AAF411_12205 [Myxococcota bacterium]
MATEPPESSLTTSAVPPPTPAESDGRFMANLRGAGLLDDLTDTLLQVFLERLDPSMDADARRLDILDLYYQGGGDLELGRRRAAQDRYFCHRATDEVSAHEVVQRLLPLLPELPTVRLERIGTEDQDDGPLVLRGGEHLSAVDDDESGNGTVSVQALVGAINVLLARHNVRRRLVLLRVDGRREAFIAIGPAEAVGLCQRGCLEVGAPDQLMEYAAW